MEKSLVYLRTLAAVPGKDWAAVLKGTLVFGAYDWREAEQEGHPLLSAVAEVIALPAPPNANYADPSDLTLDIFMLNTYDGLEATGSDLPAFKRPKIELRACLSELTTEKRLRDFHVIGRPTWRETVGTAFNWRKIRWEPFLTPDQMDALARRTALRLLDKISAATPAQ